MRTVSATTLKNRLGEVLEQAALGTVAIERHGVVVAHLVPAVTKSGTRKRREDASAGRQHGFGRREEERIAELCARGDFRPSRWSRAGDARTLGGVAVMLASHASFDRKRMLALAERLYPGMSRPQNFGRWLAHAPVQAARLLPLIEARLRQADSSATVS